MQPTQKGGHPADTVGTSVKGKIGVSFFAGLFIAHDFLGSGRQFAEEVRSICFMALFWSRRLTAALIIAPMRSLRANFILKVF